MYVIHTKGFNIDDKLKITKKYLLKDIFNTYNIPYTDIIFNENIITEIIKNYTHKEEGVRNLKRCIENIISKVNIYYLTGETENVELNFKIKDFKLPYTIKRDDIDNFLKLNSSGLPPMNMYM